MTVHLIGIGTGNPDHLTGQAIAALRGADCVLIPRKGPDKADLADLRRAICAAYLPDPGRVVEFDMPQRAAEGDYRAVVEDWHDAIARAWVAAMPPGAQDVALLVWGDPSLYDSTLRIAARLGVAVRVVPGITSLQVLTAEHGVALNTIGAPVVITTGRQLRAGGWPAGADSVAVMLDAGGAFRAIDPTGVRIWWGANLGLPEQALIAGPLADVADQIEETRAALRARHGWVMDIYLLRREP